MKLINILLLAFCIMVLAFQEVRTQHRVDRLERVVLETT